MKTYKKMYEEAVRKTIKEDGVCRYKGYSGANALSLYVYDKYTVNAVTSNAAHDALCDALGN